MELPVRRLFAFALAIVLSAGPALADRLDAIRQAGVLRVAAFDSNPPFGFVDPATKRINGLDVEYAQAIADALGVKLEVRPTNPANRIPLLTSGKVDLVLANFTITDDRAKQLDFSIPYFASGQQFLAKKGTLSSPEQLNGLRIGADKGTTNEIVLRRDFPRAIVVAFDDTPFAFTALRNGNVQAITQDGPKLVGLLAKVPDRGELRDSRLQYLQRLYRRRHPEGRDAPAGSRERDSARPGGERAGGRDLRPLVRARDRAAPAAPVPDRGP
jgi:polar amino acid transport system substrate-binding protein